MARAASVMLSLLTTAVAGFGVSLSFELDAHGCVVNYDASVDYFPSERRALMGAAAGVAHAEATLAQDFTISYHKNYKVLTNLRNGKVYLLRQCGTPAVYTDLPATITLDSNGVPSVPTFTVPVQSWSTGGTIPISFVEEIDLLPSAVALNPTYMTSPCGQKLIGCSAIRTEAPPWGSDFNGTGSAVHFTDDWGTGATTTTIDVAFDASSDPGMLHRAEWLKFVSAFFNKEPEANRVFEGITERYTATQSAATAARLAGSPALRMAWIECAPSTPPPALPLSPVLLPDA